MNLDTLREYMTVMAVHEHVDDNINNYTVVTEGKDRDEPLTVKTIVVDHPNKRIILKNEFSYEGLDE